MYITPDTIIKAAAIITASATIITMLFALFRWLNKQKKQDDDIRALKKESSIICEALRACLDGLEQLGANHTVTATKVKLDEHLNAKAHE